MLAEHSYGGEKPPPDSSGEEMEDSGHSVDSENAVNSPAPKKTHKELSLRELQVNIIDAVSAKINERADGLEKMIRENTSKIVDLETSLNHAYKSIEELTLANTATSEKCTAQEDHRRHARALIRKQSDTGEGGGYGFTVSPRTRMRM